MVNLVWLIPVLPLAGFLINGLFRNSLSKSMSGIIGSGVLLAAFVLSLLIFGQVRQEGFQPVIVTLFDFISVGKLSIPFSFQVDQLSALFLLIITGVGFLIHLYSTAYMHEEEAPHFARYFSYLNLFVFSMLLLVLGGNFVILFIGWEGVGLCSYLLIGYWFKNIDYGNAAKKAFIMNRIGDLGFLIAIFWMIKQFGSVAFGDVFSQVKGAPLGVLTGITLLLFVGATGKSAQIPLYTWLPDAMAGPTPVSALIHAATMVTAGIYMIARSNLMFTLAPVTPTVITVIGLATAIFAASIALKQYDIKKVLAYSTVSQLGYMFVALGVGSYTGAVFHVMTHAFFKALLFLGAGSVIYAVHHEQDMRKMGGLKKYMPVTRWTFFIGCYAIAGLPLMSGFFSKDEILAAAFAKSPVYWVIGAVTAFMTAFYMFRLYTMIFLGEYRGGSGSHVHGHDEAPAEGGANHGYGDQGHGAHGSHGAAHGVPHESPSAMTIPLVVLAILAAVAGLVGLPAAFAPNANWLEHYLEPIFAGSNAVQEAHEMSKSMEWGLMGASVGLAIVATLWAVGKFKRKPDLAEPQGLGKVLENKWYVDELYNAIIVRPLNWLGKVLNGIIERWVIDWIVNGVGRLVQYGSRQLRLLQSGQVGGYVLLMVVGILVLFIVQLFVFKTVPVTPPVPVK